MKKLLIAFVLLMTLLVGYFAYDNRTGIRHILSEKFGWFATPVQREIMENGAMAEKLYQEEMKHFRFAGQNNPTYGVQWDTTNSAWLLKGKLLDKQYAGIFAKIPDTIPLGFGKPFYFVGQTESPYRADARFAFASETAVNSLIIKDTDDDDELLDMYAKLIYDGKAEGYYIVPQKFYSKKYLYPRGYFQDKYQNYFSGGGLENVDYGIKQVLLDEFFNTEEGHGFSYDIANGDYRDYSVNRDFTQSGKDELAIVLTDLSEAEMGRNKNTLIVVAYNPEKEQYYLLYKYTFYDKIKIGEYVYFNEEDRYRRYQGEDELDKKVAYCIHLLVPDEPERVLRYNKEFDRLDEILMGEISAKIGY